MTRSAGIGSHTAPDVYCLRCQNKRADYRQFSV